MRIRQTAIVLAVMGLAIAPTGVFAAATADGAAPPATLMVTGQGQLSRAPDLATVAATIVTNDDNAARALSENNRRFAALSTKLASDGVDAIDVVSTSIQSYFNPRPPNPAANAGGQLFGFIVTRNVQVNVKTLSATGSVIDAANGAGVTQINGVAYGFRDRRGVERAALAAAVTDAYAQAQTIADAAHVHIVRILRIGDEAAPPGRIQPMAMARAVQESVPTTIAPSDLDVTSSITITFEIR